MKTIQHIFQMQLSQKEMIRAKRILAIFMLPVMVFYMTSLNLLAGQMMRASAADEVAAEVIKEESKTPDPAPAPKVEEKIVPEVKTEVKTEEPAPVVKEPAPVVEPAPVIAPTDETQNNAVPTETAAGGGPVVETPPVEGVITPEAASTSSPQAASIEAIVADPIAEVVPTETVAAEVPVAAPVIPVETWGVAVGNKATTNGPVVVGTTYVAPQNKEVTVKFTDIKGDSGKLSIEEIKLTEEQKVSLGALSYTAYDITSDMADGTFAYDLTLPKPANQENVEIKFAENVAGLENADTVASGDVETKTDSVSASLDHFTIFVLTIPTPDSGKPVLINEIFVNSVGDGQEWVELYNNTDSEINLNGWNIKDESNSAIDISSLGKIPARGLAVFYHNSGWLNDSSSETVMINNGAGDVDSVEIGGISGAEIAHYPAEGESVGRITDGGIAWSIMTKPTEGYTNANSTVYVDDNGTDGQEFGTSVHPFKTIQKGIDSVAVGGTVNVAAGTYIERLKIENKPISLLGANKADTFIQGTAGPADEVIFIKNNTTGATVVSGFTIDAIDQAPTAGWGATGVWIQGSGSVTIQNNNIINFRENGVLIGYNSNNNIIRANVITGSTLGNNAGIAFVDGATGNTVGGNAASDGNTISLAANLGDVGLPNLFGVYLSGTNSGNNTIKNNIFNGGKRAIRQDSGISGTTTITNNNIGETTSPTFSGIDLGGGSTVISGNTLKNAVRPIDFWGMTNVTISGNTIDGSVYDGINAGSASGAVKINGDNKIYNIATENYGIRVQSGVKNIEIDGNEVYSSDKGIGIESGATGAKITNNNIHGNTFSCITANEALTTVTGNTIDNCWRGIETSKALTAHNNVFTSNSYGSVIFQSNDAHDVTNNWWGNAAGPSAYLNGTNLNTYNQADQVEYIQANSYSNFTYNPWYNTNEKTTKTYQVGAGETYTTIQSAITAASDGDTINIAAGEYTKNLTIDKSLTLLGVEDDTIINGAIVSAGDDVTIQDLKIVTPGDVNWADWYWGIRATANNTLTLNNVTIDVSSNYPDNAFYGIRMRDDETSTTAVININNSRIKGYAAIYLNGANSGGTIVQTGTQVNVTNSALTGMTSHDGPDNDFAVIAIDNTTGVNIDFDGTSSVVSEYTGDAQAKERLIRFINSEGVSVTGSPTYTNGPDSTVNANALFMSDGSGANTVNGQVVARWITNATEFEPALASIATTPIVVEGGVAPIVTTGDNTLKTEVTLIVEDQAQVTVDTGDTFTNNGTIVIETGATFTNSGTIRGVGTVSGAIGGAGANLMAYDSALVAVTESDYTTESWTTYQGVVGANQVDSQTSQTSVDAATANITTAQTHLVTKLDTATAAVVAAEANPTQANLDTAYELVGMLLDSPEKTALENRITAAIFDGISAELVTIGVANNLGDVDASNITNFVGLYFEKSVDGNKVGKITFTVADGLDLSNTDTQTFLQNLGDYMEANPGSMKFDASLATQMKNAGAEIRMYGINALGYYDVVSIIVKDDAGNILSEGDEGYPTLSAISYAADDGGTLIFSTSHFTQFELDQNQTTPDESGNATLSGDTTQVVLTDPDLDVTVDIADGTEDPTIDVSAFISLVGGNMTGTLPGITINSSAADVVIPAGTVVTGPADWDGIIDAPRVVTSAGTAPSGFAVGDNIIEIGSSDGVLYFDQAVKITLPGVTGIVAYKPAGSDVWTEITTQCNSATDHSNISSPGECYFTDGADTIIWTYHFTSFGGLTDTQNPVITITGENPWSHHQGTAYVEQGATWTDNVDGSDNVATITGSVDHNNPGTYYITYSYTDAAGNIGTATRTVTVKKTDSTSNDGGGGGGGGAAAAGVSTAAAAGGTALGVEAGTEGQPTATEGQPTVTAEPQSENPQGNQGQVLGEEAANPSGGNGLALWQWLLIVFVLGGAGYYGYGVYRGRRNQTIR